LLLMALVFFLTAGSDPMIPEENWHLQFHITDKSNAGVAGARVQIHAHGKITVVNTVLHFKHKEWDLEGTTDAHGDYRLDSPACVLEFTFSKDGYIDAETNFYGTGIDSNATRSLKLTMDHK
jgi:hypothetical protein